MKLMIQKDHKIKDNNILILGVTFKENCPDIRNTKVIDIYTELYEFGACVDIYDPWASPEEVFEEYGVTISPRSDADKNYSGGHLVLQLLMTNSKRSILKNTTTTVQ